MRYDSTDASLHLFPVRAGVLEIPWEHPLSNPCHRTAGEVQHDYPQENSLPYDDRNAQRREWCSQVGTCFTL